ncbi:Efflux pump dep3 [Diatrype stigma]|uniref:Efflux pump dep3 n=1 Tax=Diatrype stigma TaxID=117547 RepID=A0AAN9YWK6_9PEZI
MSQDLGMVLFLAICGSMFHNISVDHVGAALPDLSEAEIGDLIAGTSSEAFRRLTDAQKQVVIPQIAEALRGVWAFYLAAAALSFVASLPLLVCTIFDYPL